jgi:malonyl-CoA decarboxylase
MRFSAVSALSLPDLLAAAFDRGRNLLRRLPATAPSGQENILQLTDILLSGHGEASGVALARRILELYAAMTADSRQAFLIALGDCFGPDETRLARAIEEYRREPNGRSLSELHAASEPRRQELIRRLNLATGGTAALVRMREDLIRIMPLKKDLEWVERDFAHLFSSWFNRGFLVVRRIDWTTSANVLEKIIKYEAVHEMSGWGDLRRRLEPRDRRCYAFFHPALVDEPLIFVEVALTDEMPAAITPLLAVERQILPAERARTAVFYSISNCQLGLKGISFGNFLIKQVVEELKGELPGLTTFVTLSPMVGFRDWLARGDSIAQADDVKNEAKAAIATLDDADWRCDDTKAAVFQRALVRAAAHYLMAVRTPSGRLFDPVARFHLGNGARLERINWLADPSPKGLREAGGLMVNYLYDLDNIEGNHEAFVNNGEVAAAPAIWRLVNARRPTGC